MEALQKFLIDDLSRSYGKFIRDNLDDKNTQAVLYTCFIDAIKMLAPFLPFITEKLYLKISKSKESVFLESYPKSDRKLINLELEKQMEILQKIIRDALAEREKAGIGVKWPLSSLKIFCDKDAEKAVAKFESLLKNQVNVKKIIIETAKDAKDYKLELDTKLNDTLKKEGFTREVLIRIQQLRKTASLIQSDKIDLAIETKIDLDLTLIKKETNAKKLSNLEGKKHKDKFKVKEEDFEIGFNVVK